MHVPVGKTFLSLEHNLSIVNDKEIYFFFFEVKIIIIIKFPFYFLFSRI